MQPFKHREILPLAPIETKGWQLKRYRIRHADQVFDETRFDGGRALALGALPHPARTAERPGVGFLIEHQGNGIDYAVLGWWDRENELPLRVFVCDQPGSNAWRPARGSESVCVWDLQVIWAERDAYVSTVLAESQPDALNAYVSHVLSIGDTTG